MPETERKRERKCGAEWREKVLMSCLMRELHRSVEQERICLLHLDSVSPPQLSPRYSGHEWLSVWIWELSVEGGKIESGGGLSVSLPVENERLDWEYTSH